MPDVAKKQIDEAIATGLDLAALGGLFAYFIYQTPEGEKVRREINTSWQKSIEDLREEKLLKGKEIGLKEWLKIIANDLQTQNKPAQKVSSVAINDEKSTPPIKKRIRQKVDKSTRFRGT